MPTDPGQLAVIEALRQFRDRFLDFLRANYSASIDLSAPAMSAPRH